MNVPASQASSSIDDSCLQTGEGDVFRRLLSHDFGAPIATLHGLLEVISTDLDNNFLEELPELLAHARSQVDRMDALQGAMLALAVASTPGVYPGAIHLPDLLDEARALVIDEQGIIRAAPGNENKTLVSDRVRVLQILVNLLGNALRYQDPGELAPSISVDLDTAGNRTVLRVEDNGIGIPESIRSTLFEPFISSADGGRGLGLHVARCHARRLDGELRLVQPLKPTVFELTLPHGAGPVAVEAP